MNDETKPAGPEDESMPANEKEKDEPAPSGVPLKSAGEVVVTHLDSPPPPGKKTIHPRRPAPPVPTREEREKKESTK